MLGDNCVPTLLKMREGVWHSACSVRTSTFALDDVLAADSKDVLLLALVDFRLAFALPLRTFDLMSEVTWRVVAIRAGGAAVGPAAAAGDTAGVEEAMGWMNASATTMCSDIIPNA